MWLADNWKDYEVLDTSAGEKLERWGSYILVRPDPQVIWNTPKDDPLWRKYDARYARSSTGGGKWQNLRLPAQWQVRYKELTFQVKPMNFKHTGVFPGAGGQLGLHDRAKIRNAGRPIRVLEPLRLHRRRHHGLRPPQARAVCHVDAAKGMVVWAKENAEGLRAGGEAGPLDRGRLREICRAGDPPRHGAMTPSSWTRRPMAGVRPARSGSWRRTSTRLWSWSARLLSDNPLFFIINSYTTGLAPSVHALSDRDDRLKALWRLYPVGRAGASRARYGPGPAVRRDLPLDERRSYDHSDRSQRPALRL